jgi:hypothetical protein
VPKKYVGNWKQNDYMFLVIGLGLQSSTVFIFLSHCGYSIDDLVERKAYIVEHRADSVEHRADSVEHKADIVEHRAYIR